MNTSTLGQPAEGLDRGGAGVARCRAEDRRPRAALAENVVHRPAQPLHGEVLEGERRPVEKFEREQVRLDLDERRVAA